MINNNIKMFCYQCQETARNKGCTILGVCGKKAITANLQDLLIYTLKGISLLREKLTLEDRLKNKDLNEKLNFFIVNSLFITITNSNFDDEAIKKAILEGISLREKLKKFFNIENKHDSTKFIINNLEEMIKKSQEVSILNTTNEDIRSLRELIIYGLKGMAAYYEHASNLKCKNQEIVMFMEKALASTLNNDLSIDNLVNLVLETGEHGIKAMALLDGANTKSFGNPEISKVNIGVRNNPGILISGHDLNDIHQLLEQTKNMGIDIYTHSEMLPANYYPELKKYSHLAGNYGNAWWKQKEEFETFNGPIIFTTNCIVPPKEDASYKDRVFTTNAAGYPNWKRVKTDINGNKDFSEVIKIAKTCKAPSPIEDGYIIGGFAHNQVIQLADKIKENIENGSIKKFYVMSGCDGRMNSRNYYTEFAKNLPKDTIILTSGCAKYRYNKLNLGDINGIPRVLDAGQCNDSYSLVLIALKLKELFNLNSLNDLPIVYNIAWYEQKAVIVLLALLHLGIRDIHVGPTIPAFLSENVLNILIEHFNIGSISNVTDDIKNF